MEDKKVMKTPKIHLIWAILVLGLLLMGANGCGETEVKESVIEETPKQTLPINTEPVRGPVTHEVLYANGKFWPDLIRIKAGDTIEFVNKDESRVWVASDEHPVHGNYPGSSISKCGTDSEEEIFDSCGGLGQDGSYKFIFTEKGEWGYHNHFRASQGGDVFVE